MIIYMLCNKSRPSRSWICCILEALTLPAWVNSLGQAGLQPGNSDSDHDSDTGTVVLSRESTWSYTYISWHSLCGIGSQARTVTVTNQPASKSGSVTLPVSQLANLLQIEVLRLALPVKLSGGSSGLCHGDLDWARLTRTPPDSDRGSKTHLEGWDMLYNIHFMLCTTFVM